MIVGISAKAGAGKSTFASIANLEYGFNILSFAKGVKEEVSEFFDRCEVVYNYRHLYGSQEDKEATLRIRHHHFEEFFADFLAKHGEYSNGYWYFTPRSLMQYWGTEYRRTQDPDYWVKLAMKKSASYYLVVIDDVRFPNEAQAIKDANGILIRINRPDRPQVSNSDHPSEVALDDYTEWDYVIENTGSFEEYQAKVLQVLGEICEK